MQRLPKVFSSSLILLALYGCTPGPSAAKVPVTSAQVQQTPAPPPPPDTTPTKSAPPAKHYTYKVVNSFPHDASAFTQGLLIEDGVLYESTGLERHSTLRRVDLKTGKVLERVIVPPQYFAEGLALFQGKLYQLTWKAQVGFIYDAKTFRKLGEFHYTGEGWGLTHDGQHLILSDGTNQIRFLDPKTFEVKRSINVFDGEIPVAELNELEYIKGEIWANIWRTDEIVRIDPKTGHVTGRIDMTGLLPARDRRADTDVLNGIAYDSEKDRLIVTGKLWPKMFEIRLVEKKEDTP